MNISEDKKKRPARFPLFIPDEQRKEWDEEMKRQKFQNMAEFIRQMVEKGIKATKREDGLL